MRPDRSMPVMSIGFLAPPHQALIWRGPILHRNLVSFLSAVDWGDRDYLVIDMPPGTGDVALGLARMLPRAELSVVTTPAVGAQKVAARAVSMARKSYMRVAGIIDNMTAFVAPDGSRHELFGSGGGEALAAMAGVPLIGQVPIEPAVSAGGDAGVPVASAADDGSGTASRVFADIAERIVTEIAPPVDVASCTARLLDAANAALDQAGL